MFLPRQNLLYTVIILQISATFSDTILHCNEVEHAEAGKNVTIKCNISKTKDRKCEFLECTCDVNKQKCNQGRVKCIGNETQLSLHLIHVTENQDFNVSMHSTCGLSKDFLVHLQVYNSGGHVEKMTTSTTVAVGTVLCIPVLILLLVVLQLVYKKHRQASWKRSCMSVI